jgi:hypothetical protein
MLQLTEMDHPSHAELDRYRMKELVEARARLVRNHLLACNGCRHAVLDAAGLTALVHALLEADAVTEYTQRRREPR